MQADLDLLRAWRGGDRRAGAELFDRHYGALERFFANKVSGDTSDLIQETFAACVSGVEKILDGKFSAFLFGIAYNKLKKHYEKLRLDGERLDYEAVSSADLAPGASTMMAKSEEQRLLLEALRRIPVQHQVVLEMFYWEDMTSADIAVALGEPHGTVRTRIRRARELLQEALGKVSADGAVVERTRSDLDGWAAMVRSANTGAR
ncbi:MAG: sigma-70 family RNA polymerase sigma factor [Deltaproteobacteria bacterium]|nr:sigma-70 family RNA polymerase sigma factor [Deltaproteobacteria bacterium]MBK8715163.1 sigma-70 family RNA polymerase sigma factor [Deltaproteobacteria bacterium]MBP7285131.1 sigma-70 family RNA polymerase sigma factor [Nannocystaceae bacterium]